MPTAEGWKARIGNIILADKKYKCGAAFLLSKKPNQNDIKVVDRKWSVEISQNCRYIVAKCTDDLADGDIFDNAYQVCQMTLDMWAFSGILLATTEDISTAYLLWWRAKRNTIVRSYCVARSGARVFSKYETRDKNGKLIIAPKPTPIYHNSLRFFRLSQVTGLVFSIEPT